MTELLPGINQNAAGINWIISLVIYLCVIYHCFASFIYYICIHKHQKKKFELEMKNNAKITASVANQRLYIWVAGHTTRLLFLITILVDMTLEIGTTCVNSSLTSLMNEPQGIWFSFNCNVNGFIRFVCYVLSSYFFALFSWYKVSLIFSAMIQFKKLKMFILFLFYYILISYPSMILISIWEMQIESNAIKDPDSPNDAMCYLYFSRFWVGLYYGHDLSLLIILLLLFIIPMHYQHLRAKRLIQPFRGTLDLKNKSLNNDEMMKELRLTIIRNAIAGTMAIITAIGFMVMFLFASYNLQNDDSIIYRSWNQGWALMSNFLRMLLEYICLTLTYREWFSMLFPFINYLKNIFCSKSQKKSNSNNRRSTNMSLVYDQSAFLDESKHIFRSGGAGIDSAISNQFSP